MKNISRILKIFEILCFIGILYLFTIGMYCMIKGVNIQNNTNFVFAFVIIPFIFMVILSWVSLIFAAKYSHIEEE